MTDYYVDLAQTFNDTYANNGTATDTPFGAPAGLVYAASLAAALDTIIVANAADPDDNVEVTTLWQIGVDSMTAMDAGDLLENQTRTGTARIAAAPSAGYLMVELVTGSFVNGDTVTPDGGTTTTLVNSPPDQPGVWISGDYCANGTAVGFITVRGVASDWTTDQHAALECDSTTTRGLYVHGVERWRFRYLDIQRSAGPGVEILNVLQTGLQFDHVRVNLAGAYGWSNLQYATAAILSHCTATHCSWSGINALPADGLLEYSVISDNGGSGINGMTSGSMVRHSLIIDNATRGILLNNDGVRVIGNIIDGNGTDGIEITGTDHCNLTILDNRITHNTAYGIDCPDLYDASYRGDFNVFYGNGSGSMNSFASGANDHGPVGDTSIATVANRDVTSDGYADRDNGDYTLTVWAALRREEIAIDTSNSVYVTAGFIADDWSYPSMADVENGVAYADGMLTGLLQLPDVGDVAEGVGYGAAGVEFTGTMAAGMHNHTVRLTIHHAR